MASVDDCTLIELPKVSDQRGSLTFIEQENHIPFEIKRVFYVYDVPRNARRGAHAHKTLHEFLVPLAGSLDVTLDDGTRTRTVHLNSPWIGLHIPPMIWAAEGDFDPHLVYLVLASDHYDENDYYRDYDAFLARVKAT